MADSKLVIPYKKIDAFCQRWHINRLELFGSVSRGVGTESSDIDLLVEYDPSYHRTLTDQLQIQTEIESIFLCPVDMITKNSIVNSPNKYKREGILGAAIDIYVKG